MTGAVGSGKSSELGRLARDLDDTWAVIGVDVRQSSSNLNEVEGAEILFLIGAGAIRLMKERWGREITDRTRKEFEQAFLSTTDVPERVDVRRLIREAVVFSAYTAGGAPAVGAAKAAGDFLANAPRLQPLGGLSRRDLRESDDEIARLAAALAAVLREVAAVKPPLVLVDGLDRIESEGAVERLFLGSRMWDLPPCPVVYVGPTLLRVSTQLRAVLAGGRFIPAETANLPVEPPPPGNPAHISDVTLQRARAVLREVVARRLVSVDLQGRRLKLIAFATTSGSLASLLGA